MPHWSDEALAFDSAFVRAIKDRQVLILEYEEHLRPSSFRKSLRWLPLFGLVSPAQVRKLKVGFSNIGSFDSEAFQRLIANAIAIESARELESSRKGSFDLRDFGIVSPLASRTRD